MLHPHTELRFINKQIGYGVVATHFIPRGTVTWVRDDFDQAFSAAQVERMAPLYHDIVAKYCFVDSRGDFILCWDLARSTRLSSLAGMALVRNQSGNAALIVKINILAPP